MKTLRDLKNNIDELLRYHPDWENLPIIYSGDEEGNEYTKVNNDLCPTQVENINDYYLEIVGFLDDNDIDEKDINCICIN